MASRVLAGLLTGAMLVAIAQAQTISVPNTINVGEDISVGYEDASRAGQTIVVSVCIYDKGYSTVELFVHLDQNGRGSVKWTVPDGLTATFNAPGARQVTRAL